MKKIFKMFVNVIFIWFVFSTINYILPANGVYSAWNMYKISPELVSKLFVVTALGFISACYGYMVGKDETPARRPGIDPKQMAEYKKILDETNKLIDKIDEVNKEEE